MENVKDFFKLPEEEQEKICAMYLQVKDIREKFNKLEEHNDWIWKEQEKLQEQCPHPNATHEWCPDCHKLFTE